jgi:xanthine/uracil permease
MGGRCGFKVIVRLIHTILCIAILSTLLWKETGKFIGLLIMIAVSFTFIPQLLKFNTGANESLIENIYVGIVYLIELYLTTFV